MKFPKPTPAAVRSAVRSYVIRKKLVASASGLVLGTGAVGLLALVYMLADRLVEWPIVVRLTGPLLGATTALGPRIIGNSRSRKAWMGRSCCD